MSDGRTVRRGDLRGRVGTARVGGNEQRGSSQQLHAAWRDGRFHDGATPSWIVHAQWEGHADARAAHVLRAVRDVPGRNALERRATCGLRSEEHTSELQSLRHLVCRLLLEKKKKKIRQRTCVNRYNKARDNDKESE